MDQSSTLRLNESYIAAVRKITCDSCKKYEPSGHNYFSLFYS